MTSAPYAKRAKARGETQSHFGWASHVGYARHPKRISPMHAEFLAAHYAKVHFESTRYGAAEHPRASVTKNVYNLTPAFVLDGGLVVNAAARAELSRLCKIEYREVKIDRAFWYPYEPGIELADFDELEEEVTFTELVMLRLAEKYPCRAPSEVFYELIAPSAHLLRANYRDGQMLYVGAGAGEGSSIHPDETYISRRMIEEFGMVYAGGYAMRPDVLEVLNPYLHRPWFWVQRYLYEGEDEPPNMD